MNRHINKRKEERKKAKGKGCIVTHKIIWTKETRLSRNGVEHFQFIPLVVPVSLV